MGFELDGVEFGRAELNKTASNSADHQQGPTLPLVVTAMNGGTTGVGGYFAERLAEKVTSYRFNFRPENRLERWIRKPNLARIRRAYQLAQFVRRHRPSLLVSHDPRVTAWCQYWLNRTHQRIPHVAMSFNFPELPGKKLTAWMTKQFARIDEFIVFSRVEQEVYSQHFGIPMEKLRFMHWGVRVPEYAPHEPLIHGEYACAVGGNSRDYRTLLAAAAALPHIPFVLVVRPSNLVGLDMPSNVEVRCNIPKLEAMNIIRFAKLMVLPLNSASVPCGHVTLVAAAHLGCPIVATDSVGVADYLTHNENALLVPAYDIPMMHLSIARAWQDDVLLSRLSRNLIHFSTTQCTEDIVFAWFADAIERHC